jgi:hypothetical protein
MNKINPKNNFKTFAKSCLYKNSYPEACHHRKNKPKICKEAYCPVYQQFVAQDGYNQAN